jgi:hypothetical protein
VANPIAAEILGILDGANAEVKPAAGAQEHNGPRFAVLQASRLER